MKTMIGLPLPVCSTRLASGGVSQLRTAIWRAASSTKIWELCSRRALVAPRAGRTVRWSRRALGAPRSRTERRGSLPVQSCRRRRHHFWRKHKARAARAKKPVGAEYTDKQRSQVKQSSRRNRVRPMIMIMLSALSPIQPSRPTVDAPSLSLTRTAQNDCATLRSRTVSGPRDRDIHRPTGPIGRVV